MMDFINDESLVSHPPPSASTSHHQTSNGSNAFMSTFYEDDSDLETSAINSPTDKSIDALQSPSFSSSSSFSSPQPLHIPSHLSLIVTFHKSLFDTLSIKLTNIEQIERHWTLAVKNLIDHPDETPVIDDFYNNLIPDSALSDPDFIIREFELESDLHDGNATPTTSSIDYQSIIKAISFTCCSCKCCQHITYQQVTDLHQQWNTLTSQQRQEFLTTIINKSATIQKAILYPLPLLSFNVCTIAVSLIIGISNCFMAKLKADDLSSPVGLPKLSKQTDFVISFITTLFISIELHSSILCYWDMQSCSDC